MYNTLTFDFLGNLSRRRTTMSDGSWFIQELVHNIKSLANKEDIVTIFTHTFYNVDKNALNWNIKYLYKKAPCLVSTLTKKFYLCQRYNADSIPDKALDNSKINDLETANNEENHEVDGFNPEKSILKIDNHDANKQKVSKLDEDLLESNQKDLEDENGGNLKQQQDMEIPQINENVHERKCCITNSNNNEIENMKKLKGEEENKENTVPDGMDGLEQEIIISDEEIVRKCSFIKLLLPTFIIFLTICGILYLIIYEEEFVQKLMDMNFYY